MAPKLGLASDHQICFTVRRLVMAGEEMTSLTVSSYIRGYHAYMHAWEPFIGEVLPLQREPDNPEDRFAVAVQKSGEVVGHIPFNLAPTVSAFLRRSTTTGLVEVIGSKVNRGAGYGLEIPCKYNFFGPEVYLLKLKTLFDKMRSDGLL